MTILWHPDIRAWGVTGRWAGWAIAHPLLGRLVDRFIYILDSSNSSSVLALEATETVSEPVTQMAVELINIHLISVQQKLHSFSFKSHNKQILK